MTTFRVGVFATIRDEHGRVLLCHRTDSDWWNQPGGGLESGETPWQGVVREVREECGLEVAVERLAGVYSWAPKKDEIIFSFVCRVTGGTLGTSDEADDARYFAPDAFLPNTFPEHVSRIRGALRDEPATLLRVPSGPSSREIAQGERRAP